MRKTLFLVLVASFAFSSTPARANETPSAALDLRASVTLNATSNLGLDITPLSEQSGNDYRILKWTWGAALNNPFVTATVGIDLFNSFSAHNFVFWIYGATDYLARSSNVGCVPANSYPSRFDVRCFTPYNFVLGHTYRIRILNDASKGPTWWYATLDDLQSGTHLEIGDLNSGPVDYSSSLVNLGVNQGEGTDVSDCSQAPITDTIYSNFISGDQSVSLPNSAVGSVTCTSVIKNRGKLGGFVFKMGGSDPIGRNLEGAPPVATDTPSLDLASNTGINPADNFTNLTSPIIKVTGILAGASVHVSAVDQNGNSTSCDIPSNLIVSGIGNCSLVDLQSGVWTVSDVQTLGGIKSDTSSTVQVTVDRAPLSLSLKSFVGVDNLSSPMVTSNKSGVGYIATASTEFANPNSLNNAVGRSVTKFSYGVPGNPLSPELSNLEPGKYKLYFEDLAGNFLLDNSDIFELVPPAPATPSIQGLKTDGNTVTTNQTSPIILVKDLIGPAQVVATATSGAKVACLTNSPGISSFGQCQISALGDGVWSITSNQTVNSEISPASTSLNVVVDTVRPIFSYKYISRTGGLLASVNKKSSIFLVPSKFTARSSMEIVQKGINLTAQSLPKSGSFHLGLQTLKIGSYKVYAVDVAGNFSQAPGLLVLSAH